MTNLELAKRIKALRTKKGYSQEELSNQTDLSLRTIQRIEAGETEPRGDTLKRLAAALDVTPNDLIEWVVYEDRSFITFMHITALSFIAFPLLGIVIPLALWVLKRDKVKGIDEAGRKLLNFQITWCLLFFIYYVGTLAMVIFDLRMPTISRAVRYGGIGATELLLLLIPIILYTYNFIFILVNTFRAYRSQKPFYKPVIKFLS